MAGDALLSDSENNENINEQQNKKEFLLLLISLYRDAPELWKVKSPYYYNKEKKAMTVSRITNALKVLNPNFTEDQFKKKINILRTNFNREFNKKKSSMRSGAGSDEVYDPKLWYFNELLFLADSVDIADTDDTVHSQSSSENSQNRTENSHSRKTKAKSRDDLQLELMSVASSYFNKPEDEDEIIAKPWAVQLKKLSETQKCYAKKIINDVLFEGQMGSLSRSGVCFLPTDSSINSYSTPNLIYSSQSEYSTSPEPQQYRVPISSPSPSTSSSLPVIIESVTIQNPKKFKSPSKTFAPRKTTLSRKSSKTPTKNKLSLIDTPDLDYTISQSPSRKPPKTTTTFSSSATNLSPVYQSCTMIQSKPQSCVLQSTSETDEYFEPSDRSSNHCITQSRAIQSTLETGDHIQPGILDHEDEHATAAEYLKNYSCF